MGRRRIISAGMTLAIALCIWPIAEGQLTEFTWTGGAGTNWHQDGSWDMSGFPNAGTHAAIISTPANLTVNLGATNATVASLTLAGTSPGAAVNIASSGGILIFQNDDANEWSDPDGGVPEGEIAPIITSAGVNEGKAIVESLGAAGSVNFVSAPVRINNSGFLEGLDIIGNASVTLSGGLDIIGDEMATPFATFASLRSFLPADQKVLISGDVVLNDPVAAENPARSLALNSYGTTDHGIVDDGAFPNDLRTPPRGTIEISGVVSGAGGLSLGWEWSPNGEQFTPVLYDPAPQPTQPLGTVILSGDNTFTGNVGISRGNVVIRHDNALGVGGTVTQVGDSGDSKQVGFNLVIDSGDRTIANPLTIVQWLTIKGNSSLTWTGPVHQDAARGLINLLPYDHQAGSGEELTLVGPVYANRESENPPVPGRIITFDGSGKTRITGGVHDQLDDPATALSFAGNLRKRGTGSLVIDFDESNMTDTPTDYSGYTFVEGGNLHFATTTDLPTPSVIGTPPALAEILSTNGAVGVDSGVLGNTTFLTMLNNVNNPNHASAPNFFRALGLGPVYSIYDSGGLMLGSDEYNQNLDFNTGDLARAANMTLAAHETGSTYGATITPNSSVVVNPNTFQLGGGSGALTLPTNNQLTGSGNLLVTNGGEVRLEGSNNYTGTTRVIGKLRTSLQNDAAADTADHDNDFDFTDNPQQIYISSTLTVTNLSNGGSPSSIGSASSDAANLLIQNSTLKYVGPAVGTNRLFTVGTAGATIDASGSGALQFTNTGALGIDIAENRTGAFSATVPGAGNSEVFGHPTFVHPTLGRLVFSTEDLVPGMTIRDVNATPHLEDDLMITAISGDHVVQVGEAEVEVGETPWTGVSITAIRTITFGPAPERALTLTGTNMLSNTLAPVIGNASDGGVVGVTKTGAGRWILTANNTYTGATNVNAGTLLINGNHSGTGLTTVNSGGTLGGTGTLVGGLTVASGGELSPGQSIGTFNVGGAVIFDTGSILDIELAAPGSSDKLNSTLTNGLTINGGVVNLTNLGGLAAGTYTLIDYAGALVGSADSLVFGSVPAGFGFDLVDTGMLINLLVTAAPTNNADFNDDGVIDAADYVVWRKFNGATGTGTQTTGDANGDTNVNATDYGIWRETFGEAGGSGGVGLDSGASGAVPEPGTLSFVVFAIFCTLCRSRFLN
jgi:fibronectin-binding autotransporter adhesin